MERIVTGSDIRIKLKDEYIKLINRIRESHQHQKIAGFAPLVGSNFEKSNTKLLVCGRAVNGWRNIDFTKNDDDIFEGISNINMQDLEAGCEMNWLLRSRENWSLKNTTDKGYNYRRSSYWNGTRDVLMRLEGYSEATNMNWPSMIAWSNIYKISPAEKGNPDDKLRKTQISICKTIMQKEIELLHPKNILFITGDWGKDILHSIGVWPNYNSKNIVLFAHKVTFPWELQLTANVIVAIRPEQQKRRDWVNEVVSAFRALDTHYIE